jgi:hypothetical protein
MLINESPDSHQHVVQFYGADTSLLVLNVARYISDGLHADDSAIIIATDAHAADFRRALLEAGCDMRSAETDRRLVVLNAQHLLGRFITDRGPDWTRFEATLQAILRSLPPSRGVRIFGEMVGILWQSGEYSNAIVLEDYWNRLAKSLKFRLYCAYPIDIFDSEFQTCGVEAILCDHSRLLPSVKGNLEPAIDRAFDEHFGEMASELRRRASDSAHPYWAEMPPAESLILWIRSHEPEHADAIFQLVRQYHAAA